MTVEATRPAGAIGIAPVPRQPSRIASWFSDGWITTRRNLLKIRRVPDVLVFTTLQPIMFVLLFSYVYAGSISIPGTDYKEFLLPGIFAQTVVFGATWSGYATAQDIRDGIIDRFRTLPMRPSAVLVGRTNGDLLINSISMVVMILAGLVVGWRVRSSLLEGLAGVAILLLFAYAFSWVMVLIGLTVRSPEVINNVGFIVLFPLTFVSNAFVPSDNLPTPLRIFAEWNPVSALVLAARKLFGNIPPGMEVGNTWTLQNPIAAVLIGIAVLLAVFVPLSIWRFGRIGSRA